MKNNETTDTKETCLIRSYYKKPKTKQKSAFLPWVFSPVTRLPSCLCVNLVVCADVSHEHVWLSNI